MIELHVHLDGSVRPSTIWELALEKEGRAPVADKEALTALMRAPVPCSSLSEYLTRFELPLQYLQNREGLERVAYELVEDLAEEGVTYAEIRFAPQLSTQEGLSQREVTEAVMAGVKRGMRAYPSIRIGLLLCCMRGVGEEALHKNLETIETAAVLKDGRLVCGIDLAGAEEVYKTDLFGSLFEVADPYGLKRTIHAGEASGPESIWKALDMGASRIGHGIAAIRDEALIKELVKRRIALEVCITSNVQTKGVPSLASHPIRRLYDAGVHVTLNTDNRTVSDTTLSKERELAKRTFGFTDKDLEVMDQYAAEAAFLSVSDF
ncbi:MAG: adenosine deaminase [Blautia sp.]|jgi:adenosine deaminase